MISADLERTLSRIFPRALTPINVPSAATWQNRTPRPPETTKPASTILPSRWKRLMHSLFRKASFGLAQAPSPHRAPSLARIPNATHRSLGTNLCVSHPAREGPTADFHRLAHHHVQRTSLRSGIASFASAPRIKSGNQHQQLTVPQGSMPTNRSNTSSRPSPRLKQTRGTSFVVPYGILAKTTRNPRPSYRSLGTAAIRVAERHEEAISW